MNPYEKYQKNMVTTMTQIDMLMKLYDEVIKQIEIARHAIIESKLTDMDAAIKKAQKIVQFLKSNLDRRYSIASNLSQLYDFFDSQLVMANVKKDVKMLDDIKPLVQELKDTYAQCDKMNRASRTPSSFMRGDVV